MPLNAPAVPRRRLHTRRIEVEGFLRDDGLYELEGQHYKSLSAAAKAITGTHWSGPAFFGLKQGRR